MTMDTPLESHELRTPLNIGGTGIPGALIEDIALRLIVSLGRPTVVELAERLHSGATIAEQIVASMRDRHLVEYEGMVGRTYVLNATEKGRAHSKIRSEECRYQGPLPVPLPLYTRVVRAQKPDLHLNREMLTRSFSDLVMSDALIDQLGPAVCGEGAMFLYGPPGTGKSSIAERLIRAYNGAVLVPHAVEVAGQIVTVFDPVLHDPLPDQPAEMDPRWVLCHRPAVIAGGELHGGMLDLTLDREVGVYLAPLQFKANNGILVIDDFGRQSMTPEELLNRWIVPLDRQIDFLTMGGRKFQVPFEVKVVLSTNLEPTDLGDEAFFRRIHNKVYVGCLDDQQFNFVLARVGKVKELEILESGADRLRAMARAMGDGELRAYLPGVVCKLALAICAYENLSPVLTPPLVDRVLDLYFAKSNDGRRPGGPRPALSAPTSQAALSAPLTTGEHAPALVPASTVQADRFAADPVAAAAGLGSTAGEAQGDQLEWTQLDPQGVTAGTTVEGLR
ncbi:MAG: hypothetical protein R2698_03165 [Microthrixaceae bacterium]